MCINPANQYLFKFNNRNTRKRCELCSKLAIKISERRHLRNLHLFSIFSIIDFEQVVVSREANVRKKLQIININKY